MSNNIYVIAEHIKGQFEDITFEMLGIGKELAAATGGELVAVLAGNGVKGMAAQLGAAARVISIEHAALESFNPESYSRAISAAVKAGQPKVVLVGNTSMGMDIAAGVSVDTDLPMVAYATGVKASGGLSATSSLYGGKVSVESAVEGGRAIISIVPGSASAEKGMVSGNPAVEDLPAPDMSGLKVQFVKLIEPEGGDVDITQQEVLVSVGRGIQSDENLEMMENLAKKLGGAVSASRPIIDNKWLPKTRQVGKSGLKVKPKIYLAIGISGAPEHWEGMKDAELIIAVNTDPKAPIFGFAHYGTDIDLFDLVPAMSEKI